MLVPKAYSTDCVEEEFSEVRHSNLRASARRNGAYRRDFDIGISVCLQANILANQIKHTTLTNNPSKMHYKLTMHHVTQALLLRDNNQQG